jgi:hypothetical protein
MAPSQALAATLRLGRLGTPVTIWASGALAAGTVIAVAPAALAIGFEPTAQIERSDEATVVMTDPGEAFSTAGSPNVVAAPIRSLWQTDTLGLKLILRCAWALRTGGVAWLNSASWGA